MKRYIYFILVLLLSVILLGCSAKSPTGQSGPTYEYQRVVEDFLKQENLTIAVNSGAYEDIQLPKDFQSITNGVNVGTLLRQRNELSKQNDLDFARYMGQKVKMYTAQIETGDPKSNYDVVLFIADNKVVGYWKDSGMNDPKQNRPDFNYLINLLTSK